jgi:hypothetical protein
LILHVPVHLVVAHTDLVPAADIPVGAYIQPSPGIPYHTHLEAAVVSVELDHSRNEAAKSPEVEVLVAEEEEVEVMAVEA